MPLVRGHFEILSRLANLGVLLFALAADEHPDAKLKSGNRPNFQAREKIIRIDKIRRFARNCSQNFLKRRKINFGAVSKHWSRIINFNLQTTLVA